MDFKLKVVEGKNAGQAVSVSGNKFYIGRAEDCHLRPASDLISRHHCVLLVEDSYVGVRDFGSKNGTYVNGERVAGERELKPGDRLKVGPLEFEVDIAHGLGGKKRPAVADLKAAAARTAETGAQSKFDVNDFLAEETAEDTMRVAAETQRVTIEGTSEIPLGATAEAPTEEAPAPEPEKPKAQPGKLPQVHKPMAADSRGAANEILNKLRRKR